MSHRTIWKYDLVIAHTGVVLEVPFGARALSVGIEGPGLAVWFEVPETDAPRSPYSLFVAFTGKELPPVMFCRILGTIKHPDGRVVHVFDLMQ
jgi:hypothetical protein